MTKRIVTHCDEIVGPWVCAGTGGQYTGGTTIGLMREDGQLVGGVLYDQYNGASIAAHIRGVGKNWMTREFLWFIFHYPFNQLGVNKIIGLVASADLEVLKFDKKLGFVEEYRMKGAHRRGDLSILTMTREQCRFLGKHYGQR